MTRLPDDVTCVRADEVHGAVIEALMQACEGLDVWPSESIIQTLAFPGGVGIVAVDSQQTPLGFSLARLVADEAEILSIGVHPSVQNKGIGALLLQATLDSLFAMGATTTFLEVAVTNTAAMALYTKKGFQIIAKRKDYYHSAIYGNLDAWVMQVNLRS